MKTLLILISVLGVSCTALAQEPSVQVQRLNTIKIELSYPLYQKSFVMSLERITTPHQSFCITGGYQEFPPLVNVSSTSRVRQDLSRSGFKTGMEYRFYLKKENKYLAPHGLFIGPYISYHSFRNTSEIEVDNDGTPELAELRTSFQVLNIGFQLGQQFMINNRWAIDLVAIGPSVSNYRGSLKLDGDFTFDKEEIKNEYLLKLQERFPMLNDVLTNKDISTNGKFDIWSVGWRFQCSIGYHFGARKKK